MNADQRSEKTVAEFWSDERDVQLGPAKWPSFIIAVSALLYGAIAIGLLMHYHKSQPMAKKPVPVAPHFRPN